MLPFEAFDPAAFLLLPFSAAGFGGYTIIRAFGIGIVATGGCGALWFAGSRHCYG
jgi:hypothetical protein